LCTSSGLFTADVSKEGGKVLIHSTVKAGGYFTGSNSVTLSKACLLGASANNANAPNPVPTVTTHSNLQNLFTSCKFKETKYPKTATGSSNPASADWTTGSDFFVMFSGALVSKNKLNADTVYAQDGTTVTTAAVAYTSANFLYDSSAKTYPGAEFATFHKF
jgi:hypothetical protein